MILLEFISIHCINSSSFNVFLVLFSLATNEESDRSPGTELRRVSVSQAGISSSDAVSPDSNQSFCQSDSTLRYCLKSNIFLFFLWARSVTLSFLYVHLYFSVRIQTKVQYLL